MFAVDLEQADADGLAPVYEVASPCPCLVEGSRLASEKHPATTKTLLRSCSLWVVEAQGVGSESGLCPRDCAQRDHRNVRCTALCEGLELTRGEWRVRNLFSCRLRHGSRAKT